MSKFLNAIEAIAKESWAKPNIAREVAAYLRSGSEADLAAVPVINHFPGASIAWNSLHDHPKADDLLLRFWKLCAARAWSSVFAQSVSAWTAQAPDGDERLKAAFAAIPDLGIPAAWAFTALATESKPARDDGQITPLGRWMLTLDDASVVALIRGPWWRTNPLIRELAARHPERLRRLLAVLVQDGTANKIPAELWAVIAQSDQGRCVPMVAEVVPMFSDPHDRFVIAAGLAVVDLRHHADAEKEALHLLANDGLWARASEAGVWLVTSGGGRQLRALSDYFAAPLDADPWRNQRQGEYKVEVLKAAAAKLGPAVLPLLEACFLTDQGAVQLAALEHWIALRDPAQARAIAGHLLTAFTGSEAPVVARAVRLAGDFDLPRVEAGVWPLLGHKSRGVREAAAATLATLGESRLEHLKELWAARKADTRIAAASWLKALGTPAALAKLRDRLDDEENDDVRDAILLALERAGGGADADPAELKRRMKTTLAKLEGPPAPWLAVNRLPAALLTSGKRLDADALLYLLHRQSRVKDIRADLEARPLYAQVDRGTSGDLALAVFHAWQGSGADADHRWVLAFAALLGDDRLVPLLTRQIRDWAEAARGKLSEYAVQALALLGTDTALLAVDALAIRYRSQFKNIGKAATEAFAGAAAARGLTPEELGDRVVPWLGFEPGQPRVIPCGKAPVEVRIGNDFKFTFRDAATGKKLAKLPDSTPADVKTEFKELAASLKEAVKAQLLRLEALMVRQFRWPVARWRDLYPAHPLLVPFARRLVWGHFDSGGKLSATFRALDDLTLTDAADEPFTLPATGDVGVVHPLELSPELRSAWVKHFADYAVEPPFAQLDRPVIAVRPEQAGHKFGRDLAGTELNAMTFKGRAERLGWARGSVCDAGGISFYRKIFPNAGVEVFLGLDGMYVGVDMYSDVTLGDWFFVKSGSVKVGSYEYDEPGNDSDPRLVPFGDVPPIAYSEALGDLARIAGKASGTEGATGGEESA